MLVLFETPAGFALFKVLDEGKLSKLRTSHQFDFLLQDLWKEFSTSESTQTGHSSMLSDVEFQK
ncbi:hypothetical protein CK203_001481 [Vitis vinifera]|uniref:Nucleolar protein 58/56 N-terminal domain-containing protein n=1 Tax=Vitis vinifera TaxID=29760 RepID=A0A438KLK2_VITVI|nr:hypothetical protein CK203_001481 [Vitis vinifera]